MIEINHRLLEREILDNLLAEIVLREGIDYGLVEMSFEDKKLRLLNLLECGTAVIVFHSADGFCELVPKAL